MSIKIFLLIFDDRGPLIKKEISIIFSKHTTKSKYFMTYIAKI